MAVGYEAAFDDRPWWPGRPLAPATWFETDTADGCLAMTAADLARYLAVLLKRGEGLLSPESFALLTSKGYEFESETEPNWYGYGIMASEVDGHRYIGHSGGMVGYHSRMIGDLAAGTGVVALVNGPGSPSVIARTALDFLRAEAEGRAFVFPADPDFAGTDNAADYAGTFTAPNGTAALTFSADGRTLSLETASGPVALRQFGPDAFVTDAPRLDRFVYAFERQDGKVASVSYGGAWFTNAAYQGSVCFELPPEWRPFPGHYRAHNPWMTSFRIVERKGGLWFITPAQADGFDGAEPLIPARDGWFRMGEDERGPEFIRFDTIVDGVALRATLSTGLYYRVARE